MSALQIGAALKYASQKSGRFIAGNYQNQKKTVR